MAKVFNYSLPVKIAFGKGLSERLGEIIKESNFERGVLVCDKLFVINGGAKKIQESAPSIVAIYSDITPNPLLSEVDKAAKLMREVKADFAVALGGGSSLDLAKFACSLACSSSANAREYFYNKKTFGREHIPLIAMPTTSGTGSEVTSVSVCNDGEKGIKAPLNHTNFYPYMAVVDPLLTLTVPPFVTAATGMDAMSHALEAFWNKNNQPICDMYAEKSLKLIFENIEKAYDNGDDIDVRENMSLGSLYAGLAFAPTRTAAVHACSYPLSADYNLSHGEACAFTLDLFLRENAEVEPRLDRLAKELGFKDAGGMGDAIFRLKKKFGFKLTLQDVGIKDIDAFSEKCASHPLFNNNPRQYTTSAELAKVFARLK